MKLSKSKVIGLILSVLTLICLGTYVAWAATNGSEFKVSFTSSEPVFTGTPGASSSALSYSKNLSIPTGTSDGKADTMHSQYLTMSAGATTSVDLKALSSGGATKDCAEVSMVIIEAGTMGFEVGAAGSNPFLGFIKGADDVVTVQANSRFIWQTSGAGHATSSTNKVLAIKNIGAGTATGQIFILCRST